MMGYVIKTYGGKIIVIDGGTREDADQLRKLIKMDREEGKVDAWFITHPHLDHIGALIEIVEKYSEIKVGNIYASFPDLELVKKFEPASAHANYELYYSFMDNNEDIYTELSLGDRFIFDDVTLDVLQVINSWITEFPVSHADTSTFVNNSSAVLKVNTNDMSVLFLGDLGIEGGRELLNQYKGTGVLKSDIVQMSHHGNWGVEKDVYEEIAPKMALWPTPKYLWESQPGEGNNDGTFTILTVKGWMNEMGVPHVLGFEGLVMIPLEQQ
jgi:beta-lactamase superfamily II metal-dependent hydrolase